MISVDATCSRMLYIPFHRSTKSHGTPAFAGWRDVEESGTALASMALAVPAALFAAESFCTNSKQEGVDKIEPQSEVASASDGIGIGSQSRRSAVWGRNCGVSTKTPLVTSSSSSINFIDMTV